LVRRHSPSPPRRQSPPSFLHLNPLNSLFVGIAGKELLTVRIDLESDAERSLF
jgi:hypothetical protein